MKNRNSKDGVNADRAKFKGPESTENKTMMMKTKKKKNMTRLGGGGLSLNAFANAKTRSNNYNPSLIKKQREFYKNAKYVRKYKQSVKQSEDNGPSSSTGLLKDDNEVIEAVKMNHENKKNKINALSLGELHEKKRKEEEKARIEREAIIQAKKEERQKAESQRKAFREKMFKRTKSGQPVMKYRVEHLLQTIRRSTT